MRSRSAASTSSPNAPGASADISSSSCSGRNRTSRVAWMELWREASSRRSSKEGQDSGRSTESVGVAVAMRYLGPGGLVGGGWATVGVGGVPPAGGGAAGGVVGCAGGGDPAGGVGCPGVGRGGVVCPWGGVVGGG